jgi:hypothetical protein
MVHISKDLSKKALLMDKMEFIFTQMDLSKEAIL